MSLGRGAGYFSTYSYRRTTVGGVGWGDHIQPLPHPAWQCLLQCGGTRPQVKGQLWTSPARIGIPQPLPVTSLLMLLIFLPPASDLAAPSLLAHFFFITRTIGLYHFPRSILGFSYSFPASAPCDPTQLNIFPRELAMA